MRKETSLWEEGGCFLCMTWDRQQEESLCTRIQRLEREKRDRKNIAVIFFLSPKIVADQIFRTHSRRYHNLLESGTIRPNIKWI